MQNFNGYYLQFEYLMHFKPEGSLKLCYTSKRLFIFFIMEINHRDFRHMECVTRIYETMYFWILVFKCITNITNRSEL
jgi:hypothetical protein